MKTGIFSLKRFSPPDIPEYLRFRPLYFLFILLLLSAQGISALPYQQPPALQNTPQWRLDKTVSGVEFYYAITTCNKENVVFLKMNNKNSYPVEVSWKEVFQTQLEKNKEGFAGTKKIALSPGETFESECNNIHQPLLVVMAGQISPTYVAIVSAFSFKDISVTKKQ